MEEFLEQLRQEIRVAGYLNGNEIAYKIGVWNANSGNDVACGDIFTRLPCEDIKTVEYARADTAEYRRKDLFYYNPDKVEEQGLPASLWEW